MADVQAKQIIQMNDGTNERGVALAYPVYIAISDGVEVANVNASNQLEVEIKNASIAVTGTVGISGTVTVQATNLDIRDLTEASDKVLVFANTVKDGSGTSYVPLVDADGHLQVDILSGGSGGNEYQDGDVAASAYGRVILGTDGTNLQVVSVDVNGRPNVNIVNALPAGSNNIGDVDLASAIPAGTNNIGDVDVASIAAGDNNIGNVDLASSIPAGTNNIGDVDIASALPAGTNNIGDVDIASAIPAGTNVIGKVWVSKDDNQNAEDNPIFVQVVTGAVSGTEVHDYDKADAIAKNASDNHDYTVTAAKTLKMRGVEFAASGLAKYEVQIGPVASLATIAVGFTSPTNPMNKIVFDPPVEIPDTSTGTVRVIRTNKDNQTQDIYSTVMGDEV